MTTETTSRPSFGRRVLRGIGWLLRVLLRVIFVLVIGALIGGGIYYGATYGIDALNRGLYQPIYDHSKRLGILEIETENADEQLQARLQTLQTRIDTLERQGDTTRETLSSLETRLETSEAALADVQAALNTAQSAIEQMQTDQDGALPRVADLEASLGELDEAITTSLDALDEALDALSKTASQTAEDVESLTAKVNDDKALVAVQTDVQMLKAMEMLTRARLLLAQNNPGLAEVEGRAARAGRCARQANAPDDQTKAVTTVVQRLDAALGQLPDNTRLASDEFEVAWQLLARGIAPTVGADPLLSPLSEPPLTTTDVLSPTGTITTTVEITDTEVITTTTP